MACTVYRVMKFVLYGKQYTFNSKRFTQEAH